MIRPFALACVLLAGMVYAQTETTTEASTTAAATTAAPTTAAPTTQKPTEAPTTAAPTTMGPTTPKPDYSNKFVLTNSSGDACVIFIAEYFNVTAMDCKGISGSWLVNHTDTTVAGDCEDDFNFMKIQLKAGNDQLQVWLNFTKTGSSNNNFHIGNAAVAFGDFANPTCVNTLDKVTADMRAPDGSKYRCNAEKSIVFDNSTIYLNKVQVQAFHQGKSTDISSVDEYICMEDSEVSNIVPIAVGCALAGLIVIVLIAYIIGRLRRRPYEPV